MTNSEARLAGCFQAALPSLTREQIPVASVETTAEWDSVASATLFALIEEEFGVQIDLEAIEQLTSFPAIRGYLVGLGSQV